MKRTFAPARGARILIAASLGLIAATAAGIAQAEPPRAGREGAEDAVSEALMREIYGLSDERDQLLNAAAAQAPQFAPAQWQRGMVKGWRKNWVSVDEFIQQWTSLRRHKLYESARKEAADTVEGELAMAEFCRREGLSDQMRSHLTRVVELAPEHEAARRALGFVRRGPLWLSREQIEAEDALARDRQASLTKWGKRLEEIARDLSHPTRKQRQAASDRILSLADPSAIGALELVISPISDKAAETVIATLALNPHPEASLSLARHAVYYPSPAVREKAADALADRDLFSFAPALLDLMVAPVQSRVTAGFLPTGRIGYRHTFVRQTQERDELLVLDTEYVRIALAGGSRGETRNLALGDLRGTALAREAEAVRQNELIVRLNQRVTWVLNRVTSQDLPVSPEAWWKWWEAKNQTERSGPKPQVVSRQFNRKRIVDVVPQFGDDSEEPEEPTSGGGGSQGGEKPARPAPRSLLGWELKGGRMVNPDSNTHCLVAGTLVWTAKGPLPIEQIERGDLVLSQDVESGELAFRPVLRTVQTKRGPTVRFTAGDESIACSGGHVFWVSGEGWKQATELASGMLLHTASGAIPLLAVEASDDATTFNLVVSDFATYFVGQQKILAHDFTLRRPTSVLVPGLKGE